MTGGEFYRAEDAEQLRTVFRSSPRTSSCRRARSRSASGSPSPELHSRPSPWDSLWRGTACPEPGRPPLRHLALRHDEGGRRPPRPSCDRRRARHAVARRRAARHTRLPRMVRCARAVRRAGLAARGDAAGPHRAERRGAARARRRERRQAGRPRSTSSPRAGSCSSWPPASGRRRWPSGGFPHEERGRRFDDALVALGALWRGEPHDGPFVTIRPGVVSPEPFTPGGPPLWLAGGRPTMDKALRLGLPFQPSRALPDALEPTAREWFDRGGGPLGCASACRRRPTCPRGTRSTGTHWPARPVPDRAARPLCGDGRERHLRAAGPGRLHLAPHRRGAGGRGAARPARRPLSSCADAGAR